MRKIFGKSSSKNKIPVSDELDQPVEIQIPVQDKVNLNVAFQQRATIIENTAVVATEPTEEKSYYDGSSEIATETPLTLTRLETVGAKHHLLVVGSSTALAPTVYCFTH